MERLLITSVTLGLCKRVHADLFELTELSSPLVEGRAYVSPVSEFGQVGNDFGPGFNFGAPASAEDFVGVEVSADGIVIK
jgi:hypothetical protein